MADFPYIGTPITGPAGGTNDFEEKVNKGAPNGYAPLDGTSKVPLANLPPIDVSGSISTHNSATTSVHGIADTSELATKTYADGANSIHNSATTSVHGIADTADLATKTYADNAVFEHKEETTSIHGIVNTGELIVSDAIAPNTNKVVKFDYSGGSTDNSEIAGWGFGVSNGNGEDAYIEPTGLIVEGSGKSVLVAKDRVELDNGAKLRKGTTDAQLGGYKGIALECSAQYELKWEAGRLYTMQQDGTTIRSVEHCFNAPTASDNITKGFVAGSRWIMDDGTIYECTNPNGAGGHNNTDPEPAGVAHWVKYEKVSTKGGAHGEIFIDDNSEWQTGGGGTGGSINLSGADAKVFYNSGALEGSNAGKIDLSTKAVVINGYGKDAHRGGNIISKGGYLAEQDAQEWNVARDWSNDHNNKSCRGGDIILSGSADGRGGDINTSAWDNGGGYPSGFSGGDINTSAGQEGSGGSINTSNGGGSINTSGLDGSAGGSINTSGTGEGDGGSINTSNGGGSINTMGGDSGSGGSINTSAGDSDGGSIITAGGEYGVGGSINLSNNGGSIVSTGGDGNAGGSLNMSGNDDYAGGSINTSGGYDASGGSINTSNGGGSIDTRGTGSIQLGVTGTRTTLNGSASGTDKTITLPDKTGYVAVIANEGQLNLGVYGGSITSEGYGGSINLGGYGGSISTNDYGGTLDLSGHGGSITTGPFGGAIDTTGQGSIELGSVTQGNPSGTAFGRTILKGSVTGNSPKTITLPNATGTVALTSHTHGRITSDGRVSYNGILQGNIVSATFAGTPPTLLQLPIDSGGGSLGYPVVQGAILGDAFYTGGVNGRLKRINFNTLEIAETNDGENFTLYDGGRYYTGLATLNGYSINIVARDYYTPGNRPTKTDTTGLLVTGDWGTASGTFCQGNDVRLGSQTIFTLGGEAKTTFVLGTSYLHGCMPTRGPQLSGSYTSAVLRILGNFTVTGISIHQYLPSASTVTLTYQLVRVTNASTVVALGSSVVVAGNNNLTTATSSISASLNSGDQVGLMLTLGASGTVPVATAATTILANIYCVPR